MERKVVSALVAVLASIAMILGIAHPTFAMPSTPGSVATDILSVAGPANATTAPSLEDLLLTPDTAGVKPVKEGNLTVWPNVQPGVSHAARFVSGGTQQFVRIANAEAPIAFTYHLKPGFRVELGPNGSVLVFDSTNRLKYAAPMPWGKDARGKLVPAHFALGAGGTTLTKVVEHRQAGVAYPVVADPIMIFIAIAGAIILTKCAVNGTWEAAQLKGRKWQVILWRVAWVCVTP